MSRYALYLGLAGVQTRYRRGDGGLEKRTTGGGELIWALMTRVCLPRTSASESTSAATALAPTAMQSLAEQHRLLPAFAPAVPVSALPIIALVLLTATFVLAFYFSTLPNDKIPVREAAVASLASILGGFGIVALFCTAGVYV
ncbi:uncharacterized protein LAESUDRAFT_757202 [Laetiporus sulphureus 93-53]|uniref:Dolichyl-diphosphooligosaccharide-protein glycosyltransferase subunit OST5 n=1 Tax=Laetiporus sulphureus 93-53 TaxID=1314785 RepID=A0A165FIM0_9APHY|nr:uncharacterized protein LAESUDRAFT_757202 [Laetiporus sulphureus 93-53]KZT09026.1 hypothetical protein LAESUDRAFT_757202 [Laetiporus sulphureus 93-53]